MMKKILLGTTAIFGVALIGQAMAADKPALSMSGNVKFEAQFVDEDDTAGLNRGYGFSTDDAEIVFKASTTADNGLEYGAKIEYEFEANDGGGEGADEAMIWLEGDWGLLQLGTEDGADDAMKVGGWSVLGGTGGHDGESFYANNSSALTGPSLTGDIGDANKVSYYTPSFSGFKAGVSFTPDSGQEFDAGENDDNGSQENHIGIAAEYKGDFDQIGVHVSGRYMTAEYESNDLDSNSEKEDVSSFALGGKVTFGEFAVAAGYGDNDDSGVTKTNSAAGIDAGKWFDVGASYATGPYKVAVGYYHSELQATAAAEAEADVFSVTGDYNVAPGLDVYAEYLYADLDDGTSATANDNEASTFIVGTKVSF
jgi:outer membrane protein OmpU